MKRKPINPAIVAACAAVGEKPTCRIKFPSGKISLATTFTNGEAKVFLTDGRMRWLGNCDRLEVLPLS